MDKINEFLRKEMNKPLVIVIGLLILLLLITLVLFLSSKDNQWTYEWMALLINILSGLLVTIFIAHLDTSRLYNILIKFNKKLNRFQNIGIDDCYFENFALKNHLSKCKNTEIEILKVYQPDAGEEWDKEIIEDAIKRGNKFKIILSSPLSNILSDRLNISETLEKVPKYNILISNILLILDIKSQNENNKDAIELGLIKTFPPFWGYRFGSAFYVGWYWKNQKAEQDYYLSIDHQSQFYSHLRQQFTTLFEGINPCNDSPSEFLMKLQAAINKQTMEKGKPDLEHISFIIKERLKKLADTE